MGSFFRLKIKKLFKLGAWFLPSHAKYKTYQKIFGDMMRRHEKNRESGDTKVSYDTVFPILIDNSCLLFKNISFYLWLSF